MGKPVDPLRRALEFLLNQAPGWVGCSAKLYSKSLKSQTFIPTTQSATAALTVQTATTSLIGRAGGERQQRNSHPGNRFSGHSTFSAAAAEVLKDFTGSDVFGASFSFERGSSKFEYGLTPRARVVLSWPTFTAAAAEAGMSRRYCGIHFADADRYGQETGRKVGRRPWQKAMALINGKQFEPQD